MIEHIIAKTPEDLVPLTQLEIINLVRMLMPEASRDTIRQFIRDLRPMPKRGPRGPRVLGRKQQVEKFGGKLIAAELHN